MENQVLAGRIRAFRKLKGHTQTEMAELMGVSIAIVGSIERGTRRVDAKILKRISEVLDITQEELASNQSS